MKMKHLLSIRTIIAILTLLIILGGVLLWSSLLVMPDAHRHPLTILFINIIQRLP